MADCLCECGCGEATSIAKQTRLDKGHVKGQPLRFIVGHASRLQGRTPLRERFWAKVAVADGAPHECWEWLAYRNKKGHGKIGNGHSDVVLAHRVSYELNIGPIPAGHDVHHRCENPACVNPAHLEALTPLDHRRRHAPTHCKHGHEFDEANTYVSVKTGHRRCRTCTAERQRIRRARKRKVALPAALAFAVLVERVS